MSAPVPSPAKPTSMLDLAVLALSVYTLAALWIETFFTLPDRTVQLIDRIDFLVCLVFLLDFFVNWWKAPSTWGYLKWGWIDFISSIPAISALRWGRLFRVFRILRGLRSARMVMAHVFRNRARGALAAVALGAGLLVLLSAIAMLQLENAPNSNIRTPEDALWWAFATVTTIGYGDRYPVTLAGRLVAVVLVIAGVGLVGTFTASAASFFLEKDRKREKSEVQQLTDEVRLLRTKIEAINARLAPPEKSS